MIRTMLIGAVPVGAIAAAAFFKPILLAVAVSVIVAGLLCFGVGSMVQDVFCDD